MKQFVSLQYIYILKTKIDKTSRANDRKKKKNYNYKFKRKKKKKKNKKG